MVSTAFDQPAFTGSKPSRKHGIDADSGSDRDRNHQVLPGEGQGDRRQGILADLSDKHRIDNVVESLYKHADHHRN